MGKSSTQRTESKPPAYAEPALRQSAQEAQRLYGEGIGGGVYQGERVPGLSGTTQSGIGAVSQAAGNWNMPNYQNMLTQAGQPSMARTNLSDMASGDWLMGNPHFENALQGQLDSTASQVNSAMSGAGRYGSGAHTGTMTNALGNIRSSALANQYNQDTQNMLTATGMIDQADTQSLMNRLNIGNQAFQNQLGGAQAQIGAGQIQDQNAQARAIADMMRFQEEDMQDWTRLGLLQSAAAGAAGNYGTQSQTSSQPFNVLQGAGALGSMLMKSDARLKEGIVEVEAEGVFPEYEFNYIGGPTRFRGVMADDVMWIRPDAVMLEDDGYFAVNYEAIGKEIGVAECFR